MLTLYITPVFYIYMERFRGLGEKMRSRRREAARRGRLAVVIPPRRGQVGLRTSCLATSSAALH